MPLGSVQEISNVELARRMKLLDHPPVAGKRIIHYDHKKAYLGKRFKYDYKEYALSPHQAFCSYSDSNSSLDSDYESSDEDDDEGLDYLMSDKDDDEGLDYLMSEEVVDFDTSSTFLDDDIQGALNLLHTDPIDTDGVTFNEPNFAHESQSLLGEQSYPISIPIPIPSNVNTDVVMSTPESMTFQEAQVENETISLRKNPAFETSQNEISWNLCVLNPSGRSLFGIMNFDAEHKRFVVSKEAKQNQKLSAYKSKKGTRRGICSECYKDRAIAIGWKSEDQACYACNDAKTRRGVCSECNKNGDSGRKVISYRFGKSDQLCRNCRIKKISMGVCSKCKNEKKDTRIKIINFHLGQKDQLCKNCNIKEKNIGVCSKCQGGKKVIYYRYGEDNQMCRNCRKKEIRQERDKAKNLINM